MGQRHPGAHRYGLATVVPNCTRDATAVAEGAHVEMALRNYYTGKELSLRNAGYKTTDCSSGSERKQRLCRMRLWGSALPINYHQ